MFRGLLATDPDSNVNGQVEYRLVEPSQGGDTSFFEIGSPHQGLLTLRKPLDYETTKRHHLTVVASDRAVDKSTRLSATTTLLINVLDSDDQDPKFSQDVYRAKVMSGNSVAGGGGLPKALEVLPEKIRAEDQDTLRTEITYRYGQKLIVNLILG